MKVCTEFANACFTSAIISGLVYATDIDADLVNMSLGGIRIWGNDWWMPYCRETLGLPQNVCGQLASQFVTGQDDYVQAVILAYMRAFEYAFKGGTTVVVAAGNSAINGDNNADMWLGFADYPHTIGVSALGPVGLCLDPSTDANLLAYYSNYGRSVIDVAAPGGNFLGAFIGLDYPCTMAGITRPVFAFDGVMSTISEGWGWAQGTSMAAPHATGVAALIISEHGGSMRPAQVQQMLKGLSADLGSPGEDPIYGAGRVQSGH